MRPVGISLIAIGILSACTPIEGIESEIRPVQFVGLPGSKLEPVKNGPSPFVQAATRIPETVAAVEPENPVETAADAGAPAATEVTAGAETVIARHFKVNQDCSFAAPSIVIVNGPAHGSLRATQGPYALSAEDGAPKACVGRTALAVAIHYQPEPGFTGRDRLVYRHDSAGEHAQEETLDITIR